MGWKKVVFLLELFLSAEISAQAGIAPCNHPFSYSLYGHNSSSEHFHLFSEFVGKNCQIWTQISHFVKTTYLEKCEMELKTMSQNIYTGWSILIEFKISAKVTRLNIHDFLSNESFGIFNQIGLLGAFKLKKEKKFFRKSFKGFKLYYFLILNYTKLQ